MDYFLAVVLGMAVDVEFINFIISVNKINFDSADFFPAGNNFVDLKIWVIVNFD